MRSFVSLIISVLLCLMLIDRTPITYIAIIFVYVPFSVIVIGVILDKFLPENYFSIDKMTGQRKLSPNAPVWVVRYFSYGQSLFIPMLIGFVIAYFFKGGWTK